MLASALAELAACSASRELASSPTVVTVGLKVLSQKFAGAYNQDDSLLQGK